MLARLEAEGLEPSPEADRYTLARRLYLDLTGLPPTPEEVDAFVRRHASPTAYERLVDRLLASPHYGERWARHWLDLARYADTNGYEKDGALHLALSRLGHQRLQRRHAVRSVHHRTTGRRPAARAPRIEQSHRHRLSSQHDDQQRGRHRPEEFRFEAMVDRVNTTGAVWLGLTMGCAQCHTHKYDPIPQREYYRLMAFFNNADEPKVDVPRSDIAGERGEIEEQIAMVETELPKHFPSKGIAHGMMRRR